MGCTGNKAVNEKDENDKNKNEENEQYKIDKMNLQRKIEENQEIKKEMMK